MNANKTNIPAASFGETHWACACVKRDRKGQLKSIKLHTVAVKSCPVCGCKQIPRFKIADHTKTKETT